MLAVGDSKMITLTERAAERVRTLMARAGDNMVGLRLGVTSKGCSGMSYKMEYVSEAQPHDEVVEDRGVKILIDPLATMFILGTEIDYVEDTLQSGFVFNNPNARNLCGCGESFSV
ncbi:MAG: iron-sulfur cluster assembly accessory protein [Alphaproteobacteria bacterium]